MFVLLGVVSVVGGLCLFFDVLCRLRERDEEKECFVQGLCLRGQRSSIMIVSI